MRARDPIANASTLPRHCRVHLGALPRTAQCRVRTQSLIPTKELPRRSYPRRHESVML